MPHDGLLDSPSWSQSRHALRDKADVIRHVEDVHFNPVKHGLVFSAMEWPYSSFRRYIDTGMYPADWGQGAMNFEWGAGVRDSDCRVTLR